MHIYMPTFTYIYVGRIYSTKIYVYLGINTWLYSFVVICLYTVSWNMYI